jgi:hypothetical protein
MFYNANILARLPSHKPVLPICAAAKYLQRGEELIKGSSSRFEEHSMEIAWFNCIAKNQVRGGKHK